MKERSFKIISIFVVLGALLMNYQNCGTKSNLNANGDSQQQIDGDPEMGIINPVNTGSIQFLESKAQIATSDLNLIAYGMCSSEQQGALLSWKLFDSANEIIAVGKSLCDKGAFEVIYQDVESLDCGKLKLSAYFGSQEKADLNIDKSCN